MCLLAVQFGARWGPCRVQAFPTWKSASVCSAKSSKSLGIPSINKKKQQKSQILVVNPPPRSEFKRLSFQPIVQICLVGKAKTRKNKMYRNIGCEHSDHVPNVSVCLGGQLFKFGWPSKQRREKQKCMEILVVYPPSRPQFMKRLCLSIF